MPFSRPGVAAKMKPEVAGFANTLAPAIGAPPRASSVTRPWTVAPLCSWMRPASHHLPSNSVICGFVRSARAHAGAVVAIRRGGQLGGQGLHVHGHARREQ